MKNIPQTKPQLHRKGNQQAIRVCDRNSVNVRNFLFALKMDDLAIIYSIIGIVNDYSVNTIKFTPCILAKHPSSYGPFGESQQRGILFSLFLKKKKKKSEVALMTFPAASKMLQQSTIPLSPLTKSQQNSPCPIQLLFLQSSKVVGR